MALKRNILFSLMIIGAIAALISGATFSAFTDSAEVTGSITAGNVQVDTNDTTTLAWNPTADCPASTPTTFLGSGDSCTSTVPVDYTGNLPASMSFLLTWESSGDCFEVSASFGSTPFTGEGSQLSLEVAAAADGQVTVTVGLPGDAPNSCQSATISLTLTVTTTEITGP
jgi:predicted ribosomally synthesized peptide with SipW-like signal peptide